MRHLPWRALLDLEKFSALITSVILAVAELASVFFLCAYIEIRKDAGVLFFFILVINTRTRQEMR